MSVQGEGITKTEPGYWGIIAGCLPDVTVEFTDDSSIRIPRGAFPDSQQGRIALGEIVKVFSAERAELTSALEPPLPAEVTVAEALSSDVQTGNQPA